MIAGLEQNKNISTPQRGDQRRSKDALMPDTPGPHARQRPALPDPTLTDTALPDADDLPSALAAAGQRARDQWLAARNATTGHATAGHAAARTGDPGGLPAADTAALAPASAARAGGRPRAATRTSAVPRLAALSSQSCGTGPDGAQAGDDPLLNFAPVPHVRPRRNSITADVQRRFIAALAATASVTAAARAVGKSLEAIYKLRTRPGAEGFCAAWDAAIDHGMARLEAVAMERALEGEPRPVLTAQGVVGEWRRHDNHLLMFLLRNRRSERYGDNRGMLRPGNAVYERIRARLRAEWEAEHQAAEAERQELAHATLTAKLEEVRKRMGWDD